MEKYNSIYNLLKEQFKKATLNKKELAQVLGVSVSTIDNYIAKGVQIPEYIKLGDSKNASIRFNLTDVASFLAYNTTKVYGS